jgi:hypothetical protein
MAKRYRCELLGAFNEEGVKSWIVSGEPVTVSGVKYLRVGASLVEDGTNWHDTREAAQRAQADNIEEIGQRILAQAKRYRREVPDGSPVGR